MDGGAVLNALSGVAMALLGLVLLAADPRKDWNRLFGLLAIFWGAQIVTANGVRLATSETFARLAGELTLPFLLPLYFFVVMFAASFPRPRGAFARSPLAVAALLLPALVSIVLLFARSELVFRGVQATGTGYTMLWGPLVPFLAATLYAAFFYALFVMMRRLDEAAADIERTQVTYVLAALAIYVAYAVPSQLILFGGAVLGLRPAPEGEETLLAGVMLVGLVLLAALVAKLLRRGDARWVLGGVLASAALSLVPLDLLGIVRLGSVALIVYAIARYQLFDIDLRVKHAATAVTAILAAAGLAMAAWVLVRDVSFTPTLRGGLVALAGVLAIVPLWRVARSVADRVAPRVSREGDHLYLRKLEVYRAAVESRANEDALQHLRAKLGLSEREHDLVVNMALARAEASVAPDLRPGGLVFGKYAIDSVLGEGGYGRVFLARDRILQRPVVIKELQARWRGNAAVVKTFLREAQIAGRLNHPNIVGVLEVERHGEDHYIVMEHMPGGSLEDRLRAGALPPDEALRVTRAVLLALDAAHAQGVVHRDVKPANILLGAHGEVKLTDFGIAQMSADDPQRTISGLTSSGIPPAAGTLQYMSPEQARGRPLDARSDIYAVGALLYRMLSGRHHVELSGLDEFSARAAVADAPAPDAPPGPLGAAAAKALAPDPAHRHQSAREFLAALALNPVAERA